MILRSRWVLPIDRPPIDGGWVEVSGHTIVRVGSGRPPADAHDLGDVAVLPGLVNAHTHLELSWMAGLVPPAASMAEWIQTLLRVRRVGPVSHGATETAARQAAASLRATGTVLVGDVANTLVTPQVLVEQGLSGVVFHELLGFSAPDPVAQVREAWDRVAVAQAALGGGASAVRITVAAHAPYSVSPALFAEIARHRDSSPLTVHLGESSEEIEFLRTGLGPIRRMLDDLGVWTDAWPVPGCDPVEYVRRLGYLQPGMLAVHAAHLPDDALTRLRAAEAVVVTCPRSNTWVGAGPPRLAHFYALGVPVAIGTDSLASVATLNLFDELAEMRRIAPEVAASALLESATRVGAEALGFGASHGTIAPGKMYALAAVETPADVRDVEEYLVGGVPASAVRRLS
jgi:aminodeoxyfutalosine deaminase